MQGTSTSYVWWRPVGRPSMAFRARRPRSIRRSELQRNPVITHHQKGLPLQEPQLRPNPPVRSDIECPSEQHVPGIRHLLVERVVDRRGVEAALNSADEIVDERLLTRVQLLVPR